MKEKKIYIMVLLLIMGVVLGLPPISVNCDTNTQNPIISIVDVSSQDKDTKSGIPALVSNVNADIASAGYGLIFLSYEESGTTATPIADITVNMIEYNRLTTNGKQEVMQIALDDISNTNTTNVSRTSRNKIYSQLCSLDETTSNLVRQLSSDVSADFTSAYSFFKPFSGPIGVVLGVLTLAIFILLAFTMVIDIAFITIPALQWFLISHSKDGDKSKLVSLEAYNAIKEQESKNGTEYVSPLGIYLKSKTKQYIAIFLCILYLVSGEIFNVLATMIDYFRGILS